ncbi:MAG: alginate lyase family protein [Planctomycetales bacterium]
MIAEWNHAARLLRTVRHLRYSQMLWRTRYMLERRIGSFPARIQLATAPSLRPFADFPAVPVFHRPGKTGTQLVEQLSAGVFEHLNLSRALEIHPTNWLVQEATHERLWVVTLHYHAWVYGLAEEAACGNAQAVSLLERLLSDWLENCSLERPGARGLVWNSFAIATRLGWWMRSFPLLANTNFSSALQERLVQSAVQQADFLHDHLEWDLRGNHVLRDAVGLAWGGRCFSGAKAENWLQTATDIAISQAHEQVLSDGGHFERSPMYHIHALEDFCTLALLLKSKTAREELRSTIARMCEFVGWMRHPDGEIPLFNDAALHAVAAPEQMLEICREQGWTSAEDSPHQGGRSFSDTGLIAWHDANWSLFFDVGAVGPDYQPGHAHADTLTIEASYRGMRLIVDPGTYHYDRSGIRKSDRSTAAHNTVCIDHQDSSETWDIFRVGRRALPRDVRADFGVNQFIAQGSHNGYDHLPGHASHFRRIQCSASGLCITDHLTGTGEHHAQGGFLLAPEWSVTQTPCGWELRNSSRMLRVHLRSEQALDFHVEPAVWHPEYGKEVAAQRLVWQTTYQQPFSVEIRFTPHTSKT